jgi:hypothetical protein
VDCIHLGTHEEVSYKQNAWDDTVVKRFRYSGTFNEGRMNQALRNRFKTGTGGQARLRWLSSVCIMDHTNTTVDVVFVTSITD